MAQFLQSSLVFTPRMRRVGKIGKSIKSSLHVFPLIIFSIVARDLDRQNPAFTKTDLRGLNPIVLTNVLRGHEVLAATQQQVLDEVRDRRNIILTSPSARVKIRAALIPLIDNTISHQTAKATKNLLYPKSKEDEAPAPGAIIVAPTHETACQTRTEVFKLIQPSQATVGLLKGDYVTRPEQLSTLRKGSLILITTVGSFRQCLNEIDTTQLRYMFIDEAHEILQDWNPANDLKSKGRKPGQAERLRITICTSSWTLR